MFHSNFDFTPLDTFNWSYLEEKYPALHKYCVGNYQLVLIMQNLFRD